MSMTLGALVLRRLVGFIFPDADEKLMKSFMGPDGKYIKFEDESYVVEARVKVTRK